MSDDYKPLGDSEKIRMIKDKVEWIHISDVRSAVMGLRSSTFQLNIGHAACPRCDAITSYIDVVAPYLCFRCVIEKWFPLFFEEGEE